MTQPVIVPDDARLLQARLQRFMTWLLAAFLTLAALMTILLLHAPSLNRMLGTASIYGVAVALHQPVKSRSRIDTKRSETNDVGHSSN